MLNISNITLVHVFNFQVNQAVGGAEINITKNRYSFLFVSNEMERERNLPNQLKDNNLPLKQNLANIFSSKRSTKAPQWGVGGPYPTGLEMFALSSSAANGHAFPDKGGVPNRYTYQGQERENTFALNLNEFEARHYACPDEGGDPQIGRWMVPDPANQFASPYVGMGNEWVSGVDPDGRWVHIAIGAVIGGISSYIKGKSAGLNGKELLHNVFTGVLVGGVTAGVGISVSSNTKEIFKNLLPNSINNFSSLASSSISGAFAGFTGSFFGQLLSNNEIDWSAVGQSALYGFGGGLAAGTTDLIPIMSKTFPAHHLAKHILRSTSFQLGGNLISGSKPFENATFGIDETSIIPGLFDVAANTSKVWASKLAENWISKNRKSLLPKGFISNPDKANINSKVNHVDLYSNKGGLSLRLNANLEISGLARFNLGIIKTQYQDMKFNFNFNGSITLFSSHNYNYIYQAYLFNSKIWWRN